METRGKPPRYEQPSFSSTLLDAIYRSMDESDGTCTEPAEKRAVKSSDRYSYNNNNKRDSSGFVSHFPNQKLSVRTKPEPANRHRSGGGWARSTSSSSDCSSYGGFSSSEAESVRLKPVRTGSRPDPVQYRYPIQSPTKYSGDSKKKSGSGVKSKIKEFRKGSNKQQHMPASPGARLASFLNAIFHKKRSSEEKGSNGDRRRTAEEISACSTASSYTRSCLSKTPSTAKRSVRFCEDTGAFSGDRRRERVQEILRDIERDDDDQEESDSSSDLFELDDLTVEIGRRFRDELPVYGTTSLGGNKTVSHALYR